VRRAAGFLVRLLLGLVLLYAPLRFGTKVFYFLRSPWSRDYGEGAVMGMLQVLAERGTYFLDLRDYPFVCGSYPPVFLLLSWPLYSLFGPQVFVVRLVSIVATLGLLAALWALLFRLTGDRILSAALTLLFLAPWFVQTWAPLGRVDVLAIFFSVAGLLVFLGDEGTEGLRRYRAFPLFWLAFFTRQNALLAPAAVLVDLLLRNRRAGARAVAAFALPLLLLFGLLVAATSGRAFLHLFPYVASAGFEGRRMLESYGELALLSSPLLALVLAGALLLKGQRGSEPLRLFAIYWLLSVLSLVTIGKVGAGQNYFIEPWLATVILAALVLQALCARWPEMKEGRWPGLLVAALLASFGSPGADRIPQAIKSPERARDMIELDRAVKETTGPIVSENNVVVVANHRPALVDVFAYGVVVRMGHARPDRLLQDCESGRLALVVAEYRLRDIPGFTDCLDRRYYAWKDLGPYQLFRPLPRSP
jgi:hypothetical protein